MPAAIESLRVTCPYCVVGYADVPMVKRGQEVQIEGMHDPRKCVTCGKYFGLKPRVTLEGVPLEDCRFGGRK